MQLTASTQSKLSLLVVPRSPAAVQHFLSDPALGVVTRTFLASLSIPRTMSRTLQTLLRSAHSTLEQHTSLSSTSRVVFTVGNQAADADSIVSSLAMSALLAAHPNVLPVPLASCSRAAGGTKPELKQLLQECGVSVGDLVYLDDVDWAAWQALPMPPQVVLLDHNAPEGPLAALADQVCGIIDHHVDTGACPGVTAAPAASAASWHEHALDAAAAAVSAIATGACPTGGRAVTMNAAGDLGVGSTCTLLGHAYVQALAASPSAAVPGLAQLLATVICLDTNSLKDGIKTTPADVTVLGALDAAMAEGGAAAAAAGPSPGKHALSETLLSAATAARKAKFDTDFWRALSIRQALEYDLKVRTVAGGSGAAPRTVAVASVLMHLPWLLRERESQGGAQALAQLDDFAAAHGADAVLVMSLTLSPRKARQLALYAPAGTGQGAGATALAAITAPAAGLKLEALPLSFGVAPPAEQAEEDDGDAPPPACPSLQPPAEEGALHVWQQHKLGISRKQLLPLLEAALAAAP